MINQIYQALLKMFVRQNKRFPIGGDQQQLLDEAENILNDALLHNFRKNPDLDEMKVMEMVGNKNIDELIDDAMVERNALNFKADVVALPVKNPKLKEASMKNKIMADNMKTRESLNLKKSARKQQDKVAEDKKTLQQMLDEGNIEARDDGSREDFSGGGKAILDKIKRQMKSPFGRMAMKESSGALPKDVDEGSLMGDILTGVSQLENLLSEGKSVPYTRMEIADFVVNMRKAGFSNDAIKEIVGEYGQSYRLKTLREKIAPQIKLANDAGATTKGGRKFVVDMEDTKDSYSPSEFRDYIVEKDYVFDLEDAIKSDLIEKGLSDEAAENLSSMVYRYKDENIFDAFEKMKREASFEYDLDIDDIADSYSEIVGKYVLPQQKQYREKFEEGGFASFKDFIESTGDDQLMDLYIDFLNGQIPEDVLKEALAKKGYKTYAKGGRVGYAYGSGKKLIQVFKEMGTTLEKEIKKAVDNIFPTGDPKLDADIAVSDMFEELGLDIDEFDQFDTLDAYDKAFDLLKKPLPKKSGKIKMDEPTASNMAEFMKKNDPEGYDEIQKIVDDINRRRELENFSTKGRKKNAEGGLNYLLGF